MKSVGKILFVASCFLIANLFISNLSSAAKPETEAEATAPKEIELMGSDRIVRAPASQSRNVISRKRYPGGADEDDLQVQENLPIPSRTFDGTVGTTSAESTAAESSEPAAHD